MEQDGKIIKSTTVNAISKTLGLPLPPNRDDEDLVHYRQGGGHEANGNNGSYVLDITKFDGATPDDRLRQSLETLAVDLYSKDAGSTLQQAGILHQNADLKTHCVWPNESNLLIALPSSHHYEAMIRLLAESQRFSPVTARDVVHWNPNGSNDSRACYLNPDEVNTELLLHHTTELAEKMRNQNPEASDWSRIGESAISDIATQLECERARVDQLTGSRGR